MTEHEQTSSASESGQTKGRATPSRKEAEQQRRAQRKPAVTRREQAQRDRKRREEVRAKQREALNTGRGDYLPARDQGPVKAFTRDYVDRRYNVAEFLLIVLLAMLVLNIVGEGVLGVEAFLSAITLFWSFTIVSTVLDSVVLVRGLKKELRERFPEQPHRGTTSYAILRSSQIRRFRLPKPVIERRGDYKSRY
ncbi:MAG: DUF3043 domain-containing protein [Aeromicrobium sp.]|uniref:DUF3043 domain-containing protein n=1 Tax=Aeromicrobium sp. TaxID=1871063 RepID=UPI0039E3E8A8